VRKGDANHAGGSQKAALNNITAPGYFAVSNALPEARGPASIDWIVNALAHPAQTGVGDLAERRLLEHLRQTGSERLVDLVAEVMTERDGRVDRRAPYLAALASLSDDKGRPRRRPRRRPENEPTSLPLAHAPAAAHRSSPLASSLRPPGKWGSRWTR
jgi:hypothetical protein